MQFGTPGPPGTGASEKYRLQVRGGPLHGDDSWKDNGTPVGKGGSVRTAAGVGLP